MRNLNLLIHYKFLLFNLIKVENDQYLNLREKIDRAIHTSSVKLF